MSGEEVTQDIERNDEVIVRALRSEMKKNFPDFARAEQR
jgi:hypothetical protein